MEEQPPTPDDPLQNHCTSSQSAIAGCLTFRLANFDGLGYYIQKPLQLLFIMVFSVSRHGLTEIFEPKKGTEHVAQ